MDLKFICCHASNFTSGASAMQYRTQTERGFDFGIIDLGMKLPIQIFAQIGSFLFDDHRLGPGSNTALWVA